MKKQIINYIVLIVIAVAANYPIYKDLQESVKVAQSTISNAMSVVAQVNKNVNNFKTKVDSLENNLLQLYVRTDISKAELLAELDSTLRTLENIQFETHAINKRVSKIAQDAIKEQFEEKEQLFKQPIPGLPGF